MRLNKHSNNTMFDILQFFNSKIRCSTTKVIITLHKCFLKYYSDSNTKKYIQQIIVQDNLLRTKCFQSKHYFERPKMEIYYYFKSLLFNIFEIMFIFSATS